MSSRAFAMAVTLLLCVSAHAQNPSALPEDPWTSDPVLADLMDWVTLQVSFDHGSMLPVMAAGESWEPQITGEPAFHEGPWGLALQAGGDSGMAWYSRAGNATLSTRGAVSLWVRPIEWTRVNGGNTVFIKDAPSRFYIQRQGPAHNDEGRTTRHERLQLLVLGDITARVMRDTSKWPNGQWRLIVANWSWPVMSLSVDAGAMQSDTLGSPPPDGYFGRIGIGGVHGEPTLIDEVTFYRRPLTMTEIRAIYETFRPEQAETEETP